MITKKSNHEKYGVKTAKNLEDAKLFAFSLLVGSTGAIAVAIFELA